jgi:predicted metalloendopeptidase
MVSNLLNEFKDIISESDWMDSDSKKKALEKADFIDIKIGYSEKIFNQTYMDEMYTNVNNLDCSF